MHDFNQARGSSLRAINCSKGFVLITALLFLLCITVISLAAVNTNLADHRMNYAMSDYIRAFQASESAVEQGELWLNQQIDKPIACDSGCSSTTPVWDAPDQQAQYQSPSDLFNSQWWSANGLQYNMQYSADGSASTRPNAQLAHAQTPQYLIEEIGSNRDSLAVGQSPSATTTYYRVTGRGTGNLAQIQVLTQSVIAIAY